MQNVLSPKFLRETIKIFNKTSYYFLKFVSKETYFRGVCFKNDIFALKTCLEEYNFHKKHYGTENNSYEEYLKRAWSDLAGEYVDCTDAVS